VSNTPAAAELGAFVGGRRELVRGAPSGPLTGRTLVVKDMFDVAGTITGAGSPAYAAEHAPATRSAAAVDALVAAGATVVAKTVTDELAYSLAGDNTHFPPVVNPRAPGRTTGGSSAGSAAAVAGHLADLGLGTDTGGSIRVPASWCGTFGWRPTHGAVDTRGVVPLAPSFDTVGLLAADPDLLARAADLLLTDDAAQTATIDPVVFGEHLTAVDAEVATVVTAAAARLADGEPEQIDVGVDLVQAASAFRVLQGAEAWTVRSAWLTAADRDLTPPVAKRFADASKLTSVEVEHADEVRARVRAAAVQATEGGRVVLGPATPGPPPIRGDAPGGTGTEAARAAMMRLTCVAGLAGCPVVVLPVASVDGLPLGIATMGAPHTDRALLAWAAERARVLGVRA
jgi:amidase